MYPVQLVKIDLQNTLLQDWWKVTGARGQGQGKARGDVASELSNGRNNVNAGVNAFAIDAVHIFVA